MALRYIQSSPEGTHLVGVSRAVEVDENTKPGKVPKNRIKRFFSGSRVKVSPNKVDVSTMTDVAVNTVEIGVGTETNALQSMCKEDETVALLTEATPSENYWKMMAENRRLALQTALEENKKFCEELAYLREENRLLRVLAEEGQALKDALDQVMNEEQ
ncbi:Geminin [Trichinella papuae]|uniref:Geminin n=1 Tax=Trichinella papuae TaxID=268474 RepID=A0A0V1N7K4_9BILA|nr:Geminin [Trichinella papuae]